MVTVGLAPCYSKLLHPTSRFQGKPCLEDQEPRLLDAAGTPLPTTHSHAPCHGSHYLANFPEAVPVS